jgi:hypothetical protein
MDSYKLASWTPDLHGSLGWIWIRIHMEGIRIQNTAGYLWPESAPLADLPWLPVARCCPPGWPTLVTSGPPLSSWLAYLGYKWPAAVPLAGLPWLSMARRCSSGWPTLVTRGPPLSPWQASRPPSRYPAHIISGKMSTLNFSFLVNCSF